MISSLSSYSWNNGKRLAVVLAATLLVGNSAHAATATWQTGTSDFNTGSNWSGGTGAGGIPGTADTATFTGAGSLTPNLSSSLTIVELNFSTTTASGYTLSANSGQSLTLTGSTAINDAITSGSNTISANLILSGGGIKSFGQGSGGLTIVSGNISQTTAGTSINLSGTGSASWTLSGNNSFSGGISLGNSGQTLNIGSATALGTGALTSNNNGETITNSSGGALTVANALNLGSAAGSGISLKGSNNLTINGTVTLSGGAQQTLGAVNTVFTLGGTVQGTSGISKVGAGTVVLSGSNTFSGPITVSDGAAGVGTGFNILQFVNEASLYGGTTTSWTAANILVQQFANNQTAVLAFNVGGTGEFTSSDIDILKGLGTATGGFQTGSYLGLDTTFATGGNFTYNSNISNPNAGTNAIGIMKLGTNTLTLGGTNTYTNPTVVSGGTLQFAKQVSLYNNGAASAWATTNIIVNSGTTLALNVGGTGEFTSANVDTLKGLGSSTGGFKSGSTLGLDTTNASGGVFTYNSNIANPNAGANVLGVTKLGTGTLVLGGTSTYTGPTSVTAGTLSVTGSLGASSAVGVGGFSGGGATATLAGSGTINGNLTTSSANSNVAHIAPGATAGAAGTLTVGGTGITVAIGSGTKFDFDLNTATTVGSSVNDLIHMNGGTLTFAGTDTFNFNQLGSLTTGSAYTLINGATSITGFSAGNFSATGLTGGLSAVFSTTSSSLQVTFNATAVNGQYTLTTTPASLNVHAGGGTTTLNTVLTNTGTGSKDTLNYSAVTATASSGAVGAAGSNTSGTNLAQGASNGSGASQTFTAGAAGNVTVGNSATVTNSTATGTPVGTQTGATINVYSGLGTWTATGTSGVWGSLATSFGTNWGANQGSPGVTPGFTGVDTATFGTVSGGSSATTVNLNDAAPNVNSVTFSSSSTAYTVAQGTGSNSVMLSGTTPSINVTGGSHVISAPVILGANTALATSSGTKLNISGVISGGSSLAKTGAGAAILSSSTGNTYSGGTTVSGGKLFVTNSTGSGTGTGTVAVTGSTSQLDGNGKVSGAVTLSSGGSLYSGGVASGTPTTGSGSGMTLSSALNVNGGNLTFALSNGGTGGTISSPLTTSTYLTLSGGATLNFTGTDSITLVDLSNGGLSLRQNNAYLLVSAASNAAYSGLVTQSTSGVISLDGNGLVLGVYNGSGPIGSNYTAIMFNQFGSDGVTPLSDAGTYGRDQTYLMPQLYLNNGQLEVVPEPGTCALMIGGLALLIGLQRVRRNRI